jgi:hypothetical protein
LPVAAFWFRGASRGELNAWLGEKSSLLRLPVMGLWKPFRLVTAAHAPQIYDFVRQVPRHAAPRRGLGPGSQERVPAAFRPRPKLHQGSEYRALTHAHEGRYHPGPPWRFRPALAAPAWLSEQSRGTRSRQRLRNAATSCSPIGAATATPRYPKPAPSSSITRANARFRVPLHRPRQNRHPVPLAPNGAYGLDKKSTPRCVPWMHLTCFGVDPPVNPSKLSTGVRRLWGSIHLDRYSLHVAIVPHLVARDKARPLVVLALCDLHAVDGEEDVFLAADRGNFAVVIHTLPTPYLSGLDAGRIAHSGTGVGPVDDRAQHQGYLCWLAPIWGE